MVVEAYGMDTINKGFKIGVGEFSTSLSPINQYFYAPLNPSGVLSMIVSHHFLTPQSISGFQVSGEFGEKFGYNATYGNYTTQGHIRSGILNLMGAEDLVVSELAVYNDNLKQNYDLGGSARLYGNYNDFISLGFNYFQGTRATLDYVARDPVTFARSYEHANSQKNSLGVDFHLNYNDKIKFNAEYWSSSNKSTDLPVEIVFDYSGYYGELIYNIGIFSTFFRYEFVDDYQLVGIETGAYAEDFNGGNPLTSIGGGISVRPIYQVLLKLDFRNIDVDADDSFAAFDMEDQNYNHFMFSAVISF